MSVHPEYLRAMKAAAEIIDEYMKTRLITRAAIPDLTALRNGFSMGASIAEMDGGTDE